MKTLKISVVIFSVLCGNLVMAKSDSKSAIVFSDAKVYEPIKGTTVTAGYALIENGSSEDISLTILEAKPFKAVEMHETVEKDGRMAMNKIEKFVIKSKNKLELKPGGNHIMLFEPSRNVKAGETLNIKFLSNGKEVTQAFKVVLRTEKVEEHHSH